MDILVCIFLSAYLMVADGFTVHGPSAPLVAPLGSSVVLPCYITDLSLMEDLEVEWRRTDSETLVHLYQNGESQTEAQQQDYHDRAHFFTEEIQHGNFSLRLDDLRAEDEGRYTCKVYTDQDSGETLVELKHVEHLLVSGSNQSVSAYDGEDVTLDCSVDSHITPEHFEEVSWRKTDEDGDILVLLFQNNETLPDSSHDQYRDRVEFFTAEIPNGNFSLRLKRVRIEDKGVYMCHVFAGDLSANATVILEQLGFSSFHIAVLVFCVAAGSGAVLLLCSLIYCNLKHTVNSITIRSLHFSLVFCPNICMLFAFILWGFSEGSLNETITCSALYILRPIMLIWALSYLKHFQDDHNWWIRFCKIERDVSLFTVVVYSVLFTYGWRLRAHDTSYIPRIVSGLCFGLVVLLCVIFFLRIRFNYLGLSVLGVFQLFQLSNSFGEPHPAFFAVIFVLLLLPLFKKLLLRLLTKLKCLNRISITLLWITLIFLGIIVIIYGHVVILEKKKDYLEWTCVILFIEVLKILALFDVKEKKCSRDQRRRQQTTINQQESNTFHLCHEIVFMFGAVGVVLLSSVTLTAELILKARNGERVMKDLRVIVFPSECVFASYWLVLKMQAYLKTVTAAGVTQSEMEFISLFFLANNSAFI